MRPRSRLYGLLSLAITVLVAVPGCGWRGVNSLPLPGTEGGGPGAYRVQAQLPEVTNLQENSRVRVGDVTVGNVSRIERQGWHALVTMTLNSDVDLPANATAKIGQTSLLGTLHVELAPPSDAPPEGRLRDGALIPLEDGSSFPSTEQTLAAVSMLLNGGGVGRLQEITTAFGTALRGREQELRSFLQQLDLFIGHLDAQKGDIISATDSFNSLVGKFADQRPVLDEAMRTIPDALAVLAEDRDNLAEAFDQFGQFSALTADVVDKTKSNLAAELEDFGPVLKSLADAGPAMTRALSHLSTYPFPKENIDNWVRGDFVNLTAIFDLTLSRLDAGLLTGTRFEGKLTELEMRWGRTIGQVPSPYTAGNPLVIPYQAIQGP